MRTDPDALEKAERDTYEKFCDAIPPNVPGKLVIIGLAQEYAHASVRMFVERVMDATVTPRFCLVVADRTNRYPNPIVSIDHYVRFEDARREVLSYTYKSSRDRAEAMLAAWDRTGTIDVEIDGETTLTLKEVK